LSLSVCHRNDAACLEFDDAPEEYPNKNQASVARTSSSNGFSTRSILAHNPTAQQLLFEAVISQGLYGCEGQDSRAALAANHALVNNPENVNDV
jgi:hypothetical protein